MTLINRVKLENKPEKGRFHSRYAVSKNSVTTVICDVIQEYVTAPP
jgi:hypothetical protein